MTDYIRPFLLLIAIAAVGALAGCNIVGPAAYFLHGPEKIQPVHKLDDEKTTVVFIDDPANKVPRRSLRLVAAQEAEKLLLEKRAIKDVIATQSAMAVSIQDRYGEPFSVVEIGQAVEADVVLYAVFDEFSFSQDGQSFSPSVTMRVRVIDVEKNERIWPLDEPTGYVLSIPMRPSRATVPTTQTEIMEAQTQLATHAGRALAQLFAAHERRESAQEGR